jgi:hypothetical protein
VDLALWRARAYRWRRWLIALAILLVVRVALPEVLRRVIASQASQALNAKVTVGDVDLRLWRGGIALEDVAVRAAGDTTPEEAAAADAETAPPAFSASPALVAFKRFAVEVRYWPLVHKTIQLRDIELASPRVALDRLADGELNLMALVPKQPVAVEAGGTPVALASPTPEAAPAAEAEAGSAWKFGLDKFVLTDGRVRFRDLMLHGSEPVELGIDRVSVEAIALTPEVYGQPARINLKLGLDEGIIDVVSTLRLVDGDVITTTEVDANRLPLRRARLYVPKVGWRELNGELDLDLTYELVPREKNLLHGTLALREVSVNVLRLQDAAVGWKSLFVSLDGIDLLAQHAAVHEVTLDGARIQVRASGGDLLPVLAQPGTAPPDDATAAADTPAVTPSETVTGDATAPSTPTDTPTATPEQPSPTPTETPTATPAPEGSSAEASPAPTPEVVEEPPPSPEPEGEPAKPWSWQVTTVKITDTTVRVLSDAPPLDVGVMLTATTLGSAAEPLADLSLGLVLPQGTLQLDGQARIAAPPAFGGTLKIADLALPPLLAVSGAMPPEALPAGTLRADLAIAAGLASKGGDGSAPPDRLQVSGTLGLAGLQAAPPNANTTLALQDLELAIARLSVPGIIPPGQKAAADSNVDAALELTLVAPQVTLSGESPTAVSLEGLKLGVPLLTIPATLARLAPGAGAPVVATEIALELTTPHVSLGNDATVVDAKRIGLNLTGVNLPVLVVASAADTPGTAGVPPAAGEGAAQEPTAGEAPATPAADDATPPAGGTPAVPATVGTPAPTPTLAPEVVAIIGAAPPAKLGLQLDIADARVTTAQGKDLVAGAESIAVTLSDVVAPGFVAGAPPQLAKEPLRAGAALSLKQPKLARGDGKEFAVSAASISVPLKELSLPGGVGGQPSAAQPLRASFGEIRFDAPAIRLTRTKSGMVLPGGGAASPAATAATAAPTPTAPSPAPTSATPPTPAPTATRAPYDITVQALRITRGGLEFTDKAVQPPFTSRYAPIELDARGIKYPDLTIKPLKLAINDANQQGKITLDGGVSPDGGQLTFKIDQLNLLAFNSYATTYSAYSIADGALSIDTTAKYSGGKYEVKNDITLHEFDLGGAEGDSLFEQNFGIPLSLALALLRDPSGDIDLGIPMAVDREGNAAIDLMAVVRSALKQALVGAISSPLKLLGAAAGGGGKSAGLAPAPIAFRLGRAEPTKAGSESAERLAAFLASRPGMAVQLTADPTQEDVRWLREQALGSEWEEEGFFSKGVAFFTERGPRERIRAYLTARAEDGKPELSAEDQATLQQWLDERPAPTPEQLRALAEARVAVVQTALAAKQIDAARVTVTPPEETPIDGPPIVSLKLGTAGKSADSAPPADATPAP